MITKYEFHVKTGKSLTDVVRALESKGYRCALELSKEGVYIHVMPSNGNSAHMKAHMSLYKDYGDMKEYEIASTEAEVDHKMRAIFSQIS